MMVKRYISVLIVVSMALVLELNLFAHAQQPVSPKKEYGIKEALDTSKVWENKRVTIHTYEEDIQTTLRAIARLVGLSITFGEGITDTVSLDLEDFPAKKAFGMIMEEYGLDYKQDLDSIHVFKRGVVQEVLIELVNIEIEEAKRAIERFGFMKKEVKIVFDEPTNTIFLTGPPREAGNIRNLIKVLESTKKRSLEVKPEIRYFPLRYAKVNDMQLTIGKQTVTVKGLVRVLTEILELTVQGEQTWVKAKILEEKLKQDQPPEKKRGYFSSGGACQDLKEYDRSRGWYHYLRSQDKSDHYQGLPGKNG